MKLSLLAVLGVLAIAPASASAATTLKVTEQKDAALAPENECEAGEACTLRAAFERADEAGGETTIEAPAGTYVLEKGELEAEDGAQITLRGAGAGSTTIEGHRESESEYRDDFVVWSGGALTLDGVTVTGGKGLVGAGALAEREASLTVEHSAVTGNTAFLGGGIFGEVGASVLVRESSVTGNQADDGGGIATLAGWCDEELVRLAVSHAAKRADGTLPAALAAGLTVSRSTIEGNTAQGVGGGIFYGNGCGVLAGAKPALLGARAAASVESALENARQASAAPLDEEEGGLTIEQSLIASNRAEYVPYTESGIGGGIFEATGRLSDPIVDSTITGNFATSTGGGIGDESGQEVLVSDTVADNEAEGGPPEEEPEGTEDSARPARPAWRAAAQAKPSVEADTEFADNLSAEPFDEEARIELRNTIVATGAERPNCEGRVESLLGEAGYNLDYPSSGEEGATSDSCGMSAADDDLVGVDPKLDPAGLQSNGGPTQTIALLSSSPAIGVVPLEGDCSLAETGPALPNAEGKPVPVDQRGEPRPGIAGKGCDVGAYEYQEAAKEEAAPKKEETKKKEEPAKAAAQATPPASQVLGVKIASPLCTSKRDITIHIQNVKQFGLVSAVVSVDGKAARTLSGRRLTTGIDLVGLPKGTFTVSIVARTKSGRTLHGKRVYHTCHTRLPGHSYLRL